MLTLATLTPDIIEGFTRGQQGTTELTEQELEKEEAEEASVVWMHAAIACGVLFVFGWWHKCTQPYKWRFQNLIETSLFAADVLTIGLGVVYTLLTVNNQQAADAIPSLVIEGLLLACVAGSLGVAVVIVIVRWRTDRAERMREKKRQAVEDQYRSEERGAMARENLGRFARNNDKVAVRARDAGQRGLDATKGLRLSAATAGLGINLRGGSNRRSRSGRSSVGSEPAGGGVPSPAGGGNSRWSLKSVPQRCAHRRGLSGRPGSTPSSPCSSHASERADGDCPLGLSTPRSGSGGTGCGSSEAGSSSQWTGVCEGRFDCSHRGRSVAGSNQSSCREDSEHDPLGLAPPKTNNRGRGFMSACGRVLEVTSSGRRSSEVENRLTGLAIDAAPAGGGADGRSRSAAHGSSSKRLVGLIGSRVTARKATGKAPATVAAVDVVVDSARAQPNAASGTSGDSSRRSRLPSMSGVRSCCPFDSITMASPRMSHALGSRPFTPRGQQVQPQGVPTVARPDQSRARVLPTRSGSWRRQAPKSRPDPAANMRRAGSGAAFSADI